MDKILYRNITKNDDWVLVVQMLIDKQGEIVDFVNGLQELGEKQEIVK